MFSQLTTAFVLALFLLHFRPVRGEGRTWLSHHGGPPHLHPEHDEASVVPTVDEKADHNHSLLHPPAMSDKTKVTKPVIRRNKNHIPVDALQQIAENNDKDPLANKDQQQPRPPYASAYTAGILALDPELALIL